MSGNRKVRTHTLLAGVAAAALCLSFTLPGSVRVANATDDANDVQRLAQPQSQTIQWHSGAYTPQRMSSKDALATAAGFANNGPARIVVQFERPIYDFERRALADAGLELLNYVNANAYFATVQPRFSAAGLDDIPMTAALAVQPNWKLHPDLIARTVYDWMVVDQPKDAVELTADDDPTVAVYVLFHRDVDLNAEGFALAQQGEGFVRSPLYSINGLVVELPYKRIFELSKDDRVMWIEPPLPKFSTMNDSNRARTGADIVQAAPYNLDGSGVSVMVYDGGYADASHPDFGGRLTVRDSSGQSSHATHVSGTVGGDGTNSGGQHRGMAPNVTIESYGFEQPGGLSEGFLYTDPGDLEEDYNDAINTYGADISNNSIGTNTAPNGFPCDWEGNYGATGALIDAIARGSLGAPFRIVWANGNERGSGRCGTTYHTTAPPACAKNHITVGAMNSNDDSVTSFTSWGYTDDGRIKPDISGPGCQSDGDGGVTSTDIGGGYSQKCGTSMSSPTVCGLAALMLQDFRQQYPADPDPRNSTFKAIFANTAVDLEEPGPDYKTGYGSVRIQPAIDLIRDGNFLEGEVGQGETLQVLALVGAGDAELKVTIAWDDVPGTPNVLPVLVNDLDLRVIGPDNTVYFPYTLDMNNPSVPAVQNQEDHANNIEQVHIIAPTPGAYRVEIVGFNVPEGPQPVSIAVSPQLIACAPRGVATLDSVKYACSDQAVLQVIDCDLNTSDAVIDTVNVTIASTSEPGGEVVTLTEVAPEAANFQASIPLATSDAPGTLLIADGDTVTMTYIDADDGEGGINVPVVFEAVVDCTAPFVSNVMVSDITPREATITFDTDEPTLATIDYGTDCGLLDAFTDSTGGFKTSHSVRVRNLDDDTSYAFTVTVVDQAGNATTDDNAGGCYGFQTPEIPDFWTESFSSGADFEFSTFTYVPNGTIDFYAACVEPIASLPVDPAGGTVISLGDDDSEEIALTGGAQVFLYGQAYSSVHVGSNGYITFGSGDSDYTEDFDDHFDTPRISGWFDDFNPNDGGTYSYQQLADRFVVTCLDMNEYGSSDATTTYQVELFFNGDIRVSYLQIENTDGIAGLSAGEGLSADFFESDLSDVGACGPRPPIAGDVFAETPANTPVDITLNVSDDGLPEPAMLDIIIQSLPNHGTISDPNGGVINSVPYTMIGGGDTVTFNPQIGYIGPDSFTFQADDGGVPPDGGLSDLGTVNVTIGAPVVVYSFPFDSDPGWNTEGEWAFGVPAGIDGDPSSGYTGDNVYGYNLNGEYANDIPRYALTSTAIDCSDLIDVEVSFWRWLGVESSTYDHADFRVSNDPAAPGDPAHPSWVTVWEHTGGTINESSWNQQTYDISDVADGAATLYLQWGMGTSDFIVTYHGWNIDDVEISAIVPAPACIGDISGDGIVDAGDLNILLSAWGTSDEVADLDNDGTVGSSDLNILLSDWDCQG